MYNQQNGGRKNYSPRNMCQNFWLRCNSMRTNQNGTVTLKCMLYAKKKQDGSYPATMFIDVYCDFQKGCQMPAIDFTGKVVSVSGGFAVDSYFNQKMNSEVLQYTIFADSVQAVEFENNNNGSRRNNGNNGYQQNNSYQNRNVYGQNRNNGYPNGNGYAQQNNNYQNGSYGQNGGYPNQNYQNNGFPQNQPMNQPKPPQNYQQNYQNNGFPQNQQPQAPVQQSSIPQSAPPQQENINLADFEVLMDENGNVPF